jgi:hypothetical protein
VGLLSTPGAGNLSRTPGFQDQESDSMSDFVICINNENNPASLILRKAYRRLSDAEAKSHNLLRIH